MQTFRQHLKDKVLVFDGAMGTSIQHLELTKDDFWGKEGCNELLILSKPDAIRSIHASFLEVGCDVIETNTFGGTHIVLGNYGLSDKIVEINLKAAQLARSVAKDFSTPAHPRYVAGSMGPGTRLPSLGHITYPEIYQAYREQAAGLIDGGVDVILVETVQDPLQAKAALNAVFHTLHEKHIDLPVMVSVTMEATGTMLLGTDMLGVLTTLESYPLAVVGMNCGTGPKAMGEHLHTLSAHSPFPISVIPNAGLPQNINGEMLYDLTGPELAHDLRHTIDEMGVSVVGGCCGTTPNHLKHVVEQAGRLNPPPRDPVFYAAASSLYAVSKFDQESKPLLISEATNANASREFKEFLMAGDLDSMVSLARDQVAEGVHLLDVCVACEDRDEAADMSQFIERVNSQISIPIIIHSTEPRTIRAALERTTGRAMVYSINLEAGETKAIEIIKLCQEFGAGLVCRIADETDIARTAEQRLTIAKRLYNLAVTQQGLRESDLFFDFPTFSLASGDETLHRSAGETLAGISLIKSAFPESFTCLNLSNVSAGLKPDTRELVNSVFLHLAIEAGLDAAMLHAEHILPYHKIKEADRKLCEDFILNRETPDHDPLVNLLEAHIDPEMATIIEGDPWELPRQIASIPEPPFWGRRVIHDIGLNTIFPFINKAALFRGQWGFKQGQISPEDYAKIEQETIFPTFDRLTTQVINEQLLIPTVIYGYYACQSEGNRLWIYGQPDDEQPLYHIDFPRQSKPPKRAIPDFFCSIESGKRDVLAFQLVTIGKKASEYAHGLYAKNAYAEYLYFHGLAAETAEALAEYWHQQIRQELNIHQSDGDEVKQLFHQKYQGSRYSFGYPACPELKDQELIFKLLDAPAEGIMLTEDYQIIPEQSTSAIIVHHPEATFFSV
ncbi:MAG: homocysteine S-methyltransferase family protein [Candidatus Marinimicrobia bacterium]|nr:homocysteine S-methyltransferase family protein [Candidatus Neomarinimicrobiota bacterium]